MRQYVQTKIETYQPLTVQLKWNIKQNLIINVTRHESTLHKKIHYVHGCPNNQGH